MGCGRSRSGRGAARSPGALRLRVGLWGGGLDVGGGCGGGAACCWLGLVVRRDSGGQVQLGAQRPNRGGDLGGVVGAGGTITAVGWMIGVGAGELGVGVGVGVAIVVEVGVGWDLW